MEIERKFLVRDTDKILDLMQKYESNKKIITQDYVYSDIFTAIRKRKMQMKDTVKYIYTIKTGRTGLYSVNEIESEITEEQYNLLKKDDARITIEKERFCIPYLDGLVIELDVFHGIYEGVIFAEIEFKSEEQAKNIKLPDWFAEEIGNKVSNDMMSKKFIDINSIV